MKTAEITILHRVRRAASRGVTLIEILIVLANRRAHRRRRRGRRHPEVRRVTEEPGEDRRAHDPSRGREVQARPPGSAVPDRRAAPSRQGSSSAASKITDPWETPYAIRCNDEDLYIVSFGPDKKEGTADDIRIPDTSAVAPPK